MFAVEVRDHVMIAHSFRGEMFGPGQPLLVVTQVEIRRDQRCLHFFPVERGRKRGFFTAPDRIGRNDSGSEAIAKRIKINAPFPRFDALLDGQLFRMPGRQPLAKFHREGTHFVKIRAAAETQRKPMSGLAKDAIGPILTLLPSAIPEV